MMKQTSLQIFSFNVKYWFLEVHLNLILILLKSMKKSGQKEKNLKVTLSNSTRAAISTLSAMGWIWPKQD